ncbi:uncharacterized protein LOC110721505 [Chenopodium quinoa]|uniref:uncharacterized protein LOC110721505 n=1 Tax=Chenopodium quinoa TaxID=63459 RepID=UPI000B78A60E|nr:uncharacterized protein LOC110721505 [Chenopodium quinoa]
MEPEEGSSSSPSIENPPLTSSEIYSVEKALKSLELSNPWIQQAIQQAFLVQETVEQSFDSTIAATRSRLSQIRSTSSAHFHQTLESVKDLKAEYDAYEAKFFGKVKEGAFVAASHPFIATGAVTGLGLLALPAPRRFLYYKTLRLFSTEEALISRADEKVKELKQSFERLKAATEKLEKRASQAEEEMQRGRTKLRNAGNQIRKAVNSADKIEKQARGLKDILADLPSRESSRFNSQIKNLVAEAKQERKVLAKEVTKISNYGISI